MSAPPISALKFLKVQEITSLLVKIAYIAPPEKLLVPSMNEVEVMLTVLSVVEYMKVPPLDTWL